MPAVDSHRMKPATGLAAATPCSLSAKLKKVQSGCAHWGRIGFDGIVSRCGGVSGFELP